MKKRDFNYKKFAYEQGFGTKKSSNIELTFKNPIHRHYKEIIDALANCDYKYIQDVMQKAVEYKNKLKGRI